MISRLYANLMRVSFSFSFSFFDYHKINQPISRLLVNATEMPLSLLLFVFLWIFGHSLPSPLYRFWPYPFALLSIFSLPSTFGSRLSIVRLQMTGLDYRLLPIQHRYPRLFCSLSLSFWIFPPKLSFQSLCSNMLIHICYPKCNLDICVLIFVLRVFVLSMSCYLFVSAV